MDKNNLEPMQYYRYDDGIFLAKRGDSLEPSDVYRYIIGKKKWVKYDIRDEGWGTADTDISRSSDVSLERLKKEGIPPVEDDTPDVTTKLLAEANKKKKRTSK